MKVNKKINDSYNTGLEIDDSNWSETVDDMFEELLLTAELTNPGAKYLIRKLEGVSKWSKARPLVHRFHKTDFYTAEHILPDSTKGFSSKQGDYWAEHSKHNSWQDPDKKRKPQAKKRSNKNPLRKKKPKPEKKNRPQKGRPANSKASYG